MSEGRRYLGVVIPDPAAALVVGGDLDGRKRKFTTAGFHLSSPTFPFFCQSHSHQSPLPSISPPLPPFPTNRYFFPLPPCCPGQPGQPFRELLLPPSGNYSIALSLVFSVTTRSVTCPPFNLHRHLLFVDSLLT